MTWSRSLAISVGIRDSRKFELLVADHSGSDKSESSGLWADYLNGQRRCFLKWEPKPFSTWVAATEEIWPKSASWFWTPIWYLMEEQEYLPSQIIQCCELLPQQLREELLSPPEPGIPEPMRLKELWPDRVYELSKQVSPWSLGAMACAFRRAELAGQPPVYLRAGLGMLWVLDQLTEAQNLWLIEPLDQLRKIILNRLNDTVYDLDGPAKISIAQSSMDFFANGRKKYLVKRNAPFDLEDAGETDAIFRGRN